MTDRELMQQALEALEQHSAIKHPQQRHYRDAAIDALRERLAQPVQDWESEYTKQVELHNQTLDELRDALAQPEQEPVVWMYVNRSTHETVFQRTMRSFVDHGHWTETPLYSEPLANHELQCVCGAVWLGDEMVHLPDKRPLASKPWVGLNAEECNAILFRSQDIADAIARTSAKLREKNT